MSSNTDDNDLKYKSERLLAESLRDDVARFLQRQEDRKRVHADGMPGEGTPDPEEYADLVAAWIPFTPPPPPGQTTTGLATTEPSLKTVENTRKETSETNPAVRPCLVPPPVDGEKYQQALRSAVTEGRLHRIFLSSPSLPLLPAGICVGRGPPPRRGTLNVFTVKIITSCVLVLAVLAGGPVGVL